MPTAQECFEAFYTGVEQQRASRLDSGVFANCACEIHSLTENGGEGVPHNSVLVRVLTDPKQYSLMTSEMLDAPLEGVHGRGFSMVRSGASDDEIRATIKLLVERSREPQALAGATTITVQTVREMEAGTRWFGVYATNDEGNQHHADILGTRPLGTKKEINDLKIARRRQLRRLLEQNIIVASSEEELIGKLRAVGV